MKELSIEDKAKRYDEAIGRAKLLQSKWIDEDGKTVAEMFFPELKESEDEKIRKYIIDVVNDYCKGSEHDGCIAWLEKQGEQKSIEWSGKICSKHAEGKLKEMLDRKEKSACCEEDNVFFKAIIRDIENVQYISEDAKKDRINWLKSLKDRVQQKPKQEYDDMAYEMSRAVLYDKLKDSLLPQNTWKPSDEQMEALDVFIYAKYPNIEKYGAAVKSLYQDLKKLIGE